MIRSMTGFGAETLIRNGKSLTVEIRSVNHRYCEINIKLPKELYFLENGIRNQLKQKLLRGKIEVFVQYQRVDGLDVNISYIWNRMQGRNNNFYYELNKDNLLFKNVKDYIPADGFQVFDAAGSFSGGRRG